VELGLNIKNGISDVFISPYVRKPNKAVLGIIRQTLACSQNGIIPIFIAPFVEKSIKSFFNAYCGLYCQTLLQFFDPANQTLCDDVIERLNFGNVRVATQVTPHIADWISKIPERWNNLYSAATGKTI